MKYTVNKIDAAIDQLDWAIKLFIEHKAYVPSITLAGAAEEILGEAVSSEASYRKLKKSLALDSGIDEKIVGQEYLNKTKNWLKHWKSMKDDENLEIELETEAIQYLIRTIRNLYTHDNTISSQTLSLFKWSRENRKDLTNGNL